MSELYVPVNVQALVVGEGGMQVADMESSFWELERRPLGDVAAVKPFQKRKLSSGIHLHWTMPDSLLHGIKEKEELHFPQLPNRWVIQRLEKLDDRIERKAWVIASDVIHPFDPDEEYGNESVSIPVYTRQNNQFIPAGPKEKPYGYLGSCVPCEDYKEDVYSTMQRMELTAIGWGEPEFAAAYQKCASSYGFWDCITQEEPTQFTYVVCGYYADETKDPLYQMKDLSAQLEWKIVDGKEGETPEKTVCHGTIRGVKWCGKNAKISGGVPEAEVEAAVGNNSAEALAAIVQAKLSKEPGVERLFVYHQQDLLKQLNSPGEDTLIEMEEEMHRRQFGDVCVGYCYEVERKKEQETYYPLEEEHYRQIEQLNDAQRRADDLVAKQQSLSSQLYMLWWLYVTLYDRENAIENKEEQIKQCLCQMQNCVQTYKCQNSILEKMQKQIKEEFKNLKRQIDAKHMQLLKKEICRGYEPQAPVILVHGEGVQRSYRQGFQQENDGLLPCRLHTVASRKIICEKGSMTVTARQVSDFVGQHLFTVPPFCEALMAETVLLDDDLLCPAAGISTAKDSSISDDSSAALPFEIAMADWKQPWNPLELMWEISLNPVNANADPTKLMEHFQPGEIDLEWDGAGENPQEFLVSGSALLTPHAATTMKEQTMKLMKSRNLCTDSGKNLLRVIEKQDTLSQQLGGFQEAFLRTRETIQIPIWWRKWKEQETKLSLAEIQECIKEIHCSPLFHQNGEYLPVRAGIGRISRLWIVDSFGQFKQVVDWGKEAKILIAESLRMQEQKCFLLPPRILQGCWIDSRWLAAGKKQRDAIDPYTTPVCGFLRPDFIHKIIYLYDNQGNGIGSLETTGQGCHFAPSLGTHKKIEEIENEVVRKFVYGMCSEKKALAELLDYLTIYLEHILIGESVDFYEFCFGKILVLAQAELSVEAYGDYCRCFSAEENTTDIHYETDGYENRTFSVKMGDARKCRDGLAGFFEADKMDLFFAVDQEAAGEGGQYVKSQDIWLHTLSEMPRRFTLMFDPLSKITVRTGFLPAAELKLKSCFYESSLKHIKTIFPVWPVVTGEDRVTFPIPESEEKNWKWIEKNLNGEEQERKIDKISDTLLEGAYRITEGYVKKEEKDDCC